MIKRLLQDRPLSHFTIIIATIVILPSILFLIFFDRSMQVNLEDEAIQKNKSTSSLIANNIEQLIQANDYIIEGIKFSIEFYPYDNENIQEHLKTVVQSSEFINKIEIIDYDGTLMHSSDEDAIIGISKSGENFFIDTINTSKTFYWSSPYIPPLQDTLVVAITHKTDEHIIVGYINISTLSIIERYITTEKDENVKIYVTDENGILVISDDPVEVTRRYRFEHFDQLKESLASGNDTEYIDDQGFKALATITETSNNWYVITHENLNSINEIEISIRNDFSIFILLIITLTVWMIFYAIDILKRSFENVTNKMHEVTEGNLDTIITDRSLSEINQITDSFNLMTESLKKSNEELIKKSETDTLTGLLTRKALHEYFETLKGQYDVNFVVIYIDIERFAVVNESYGIDFADRCLIEISKRLRLIKPFMISRAESDEFIMVFDQVMSRATCVEIVDKIKLLFARPVIIDGVEMNIELKLGISRYPVEEQTISHLITSSTIALKHAKDENKFYTFYESEMGKGYQRQVELEVSLKDAFRNDEFYPVLQPIVNCQTNEIERFELLARWTHPGLGPVFPDDFIPLLERTNMIHELDLYILEYALQHHLTLKRLFNKEFVMCVNLSVKHIHRNDFIYRISSLVERYQVEPKFIEFEVTESIFIEDYEHVKAKMDELIDIGFKFSQDDFGDGYSSLSYLARLNLSTLKISKSFLSNLTDANNTIMIESIVDLSNRLGIDIIVEGVEDKETLDYFKNSNCKLIQGYYFYKPTTFENIIAILKGAE